MPIIGDQTMSDLHSTSGKASQPPDKEGRAATTWAEAPTAVSHSEPATTKPTLEVVSVPKEFLDELRAHQDRLNNYVQGYIAGRDQSVRCEKIRARLELGRRRRDKLPAYDYWADIRDWLDNVSPLSLALPEGLHTVVGDEMNAFDSALEAAKQQVGTAILASPNVDLVALMDRAYEAVTTMLASADRVAQKCKRNTDTVLREVRSCIVRIFAHIDAQRREAMRESDRNPATSVPPEPSSSMGEELRSLYSQLDQRRTNLRWLQEQETMYVAGQAPVSLLNQIKAEQEAIDDLEKRIRTLEVRLGIEPSSQRAAYQIKIQEQAIRVRRQSFRLETR